MAHVEKSGRVDYTRARTHTCKTTHNANYMAKQAGGGGAQLFRSDGNVTCIGSSIYHMFHICTHPHVQAAGGA